jgi:hypothetical protein
MEYLKRTFMGKDDRDFHHVVVPLSTDRSLSQEVKAEEHTRDAKVEESTGSIKSGTSGKSTTTLESLRAEVDSDVAAEGHNTSYDRM